MSARELITEHLELWTAAVSQKSTRGRGSSSKVELTGIKKLRELILELAIRGKLVEQSTADEPATATLQKLAVEKENLVKKGAIKKGKKDDKISNRDHPFEISASWCWTRLATVSANIHYGYTASADPANMGGFRLLRITDIQDDKVNWGTVPGCDISESKAQQYRLSEGDILIARTGGTIGKSFLVSNVTVDSVFASYLIRVQKLNAANQRFLKIFLGSNLYWHQIYEKSMGTGQPNVNGNALKSLLLPLPPEDEQHRIVKKVDELMALCDRLEQQTSDQLEAHEPLVDTLLGTLTRSQNATELSDNWARLAAHFDTLFTTEQSIEKLKQAILQLAVMGRLVNQDAADKSANVLLEKVADEKGRLLHEGMIKKQKVLASHSSDAPYKVPDGWRWEKLGNFTLVGTGATPSRGRTDYYSPSEHPWVTSGETSQDFITDTKEKISSLAVKETNVTIYPIGTLIVAMYGQGKTRGQISELKVAAGTNQACAAIQPLINDLNHRRYIKLCFVKLYDEIREGAAGGAQPNLNTGKIANTLIPLPPLAEQHRIVQKVDELMAVCDQLKERLNQASETRCQLANAVVTGALN